MLSGNGVYYRSEPLTLNPGDSLYLILPMFIKPGSWKTPAKVCLCFHAGYSQIQRKETKR